MFSADDAENGRSRGEQVILVRRETTPDDYHGMIASQGILTSAGGTNSHAAVVARGEGIPAVCGADEIKIDPRPAFSRERHDVAEGDVVTIDGFTGDVLRRASLPLEESVLEKARSGDAEARGERSGRRSSGSWRPPTGAGACASARTPTRPTRRRTPATAAPRASGCAGPSTCSWARNASAVRQMIFAESAEEEQAAYDALPPLQRGDFVGIFRAMDGLPVTVRLLDPPLHEFLPDQVDLRRRGRARARSGARRAPSTTRRACSQKVDELHEMNPMLGLRGVRLGIVKPGLYAMQVRAIVEAACEVEGRRDPKVEIMIPLVATRAGARADARRARAGGERDPRARGRELGHLEWGTMIELPRAAVTAGEIAEVADFFSFGTNDLTQTAFGFSRDDIGKFVGLYEERKLSRRTRS